MGGNGRILYGTRQLPVQEPLHGSGYRAPRRLLWLRSRLQVCHPAVLLPGVDCFGRGLYAGAGLVVCQVETFLRAEWQSGYRAVQQFRQDENGIVCVRLVVRSGCLSGVYRQSFAGLGEDLFL
ncbi:hypothetical protein Barb7_02015 [Bacteroidales bacterium Barb7]|nr:hypothetical protein Barb7_02015 [Bacteroidales bacterium Barb7]